jgi:pilus assembly protein Flp/PilA
MYYIAKFLKEDSGQGMVEYGLIIALVAVLVVGTLSSISEPLNDIFDRMSDEFNSRVT